MTVIRHAVVEDIPCLVRLGKAFYDEGQPPCGFDADSVKASLRYLIDSPDGYLSVAEIDPGEVFGMLGALKYPSPFNRNYLTVGEQFWWVIPEFRKHKSGLALLDHAEAWAKEQGAHSMNMACLSELNAERMSALYASLGYTPVDRVFAKRLN